MKLFLITIDYELFGDGSGDVFHDVIEPTEQILSIADHHGVKVTIFYEWLEFRRLNDVWESGESMGYETNPAEAAKKQMIQAIQNGHDVQLHLHPQWQKSFFKDGKWIIDEESWRLSDFVPVAGMTRDWMLKTGKAELEAMLKPYNPDYRCVALRAGGYNADPGKKYIDLLKQFNFFADSSVYTGGIENGLSRYDYSQVTNEKGYWRSDLDIRKSENTSTGVFELPIMALPLLKIQKYFQWKKIIAAIQNVRKANTNLVNKLDHDKNHGLISKITYFFGKEFQTWDFCINSNAMQRKFLRETERLNGTVGRDVFTVIGHSKGFKNNPHGLSYLLKELTTQKNSRCITISDFLKEHLEN